MVASYILAALGVVSNLKAVDLLPVGPARLAAPSLGWLFTALLLRARYSVAVLSALVVAQLAGVALVVRGGPAVYRSDLALRTTVLPFAASVLGGVLGTFVARPATAALAAVLTVQLWAAVGGVVMLLCYPASIVQVLQPQAERERELLAEGQSLTNSGARYDRRFVVSPQTGVRLDTVVVRPPQPTTRWALYIGGNAQFMESGLSEAAYYSRHLFANVILYNPRGIGRSSGGYVARASDLIEDAAAVASHYVQTAAIAPRQLLFIGHSIGGGTAAEVCARCFPDSSLVLDRSFSSLSEAAVAFSPLSARLTTLLLPLCVGDLRTMDAWYALRHQRKLILYTRLDEILTYDVCCPARHEIRDIEPPESYHARVVELHGAGITSWHNACLSSFTEAARVLATMSSFFATSGKET